MEIEINGQIVPGAALAQIQGGVIVNQINVVQTSITANDGGGTMVYHGLDDPTSLNSEFGTGPNTNGQTPMWQNAPFDCAPIRIDNLSPTPSIGWTYDGVGTFTSPDQSQTVSVQS